MLLSKERYTKKSDVQVAGMLLHYVMTLQHPYGDDYETCEENIKKDIPCLHPQADSMFVSLMNWMLHPSTDLRKDVKTCLK